MPDFKRNPEFQTVSGKAMYARLFEPATPAPSQEGIIPVRWSVDVLVTQAMLTRLKEKGMKISKPNPKYFELAKQNGWDQLGYDGSHVEVRKNIVKKSWDAQNGRVRKNDVGQEVLESATRPPVCDSNGTEIPMEAFTEKGFRIGNGSDVEVTYTETKPKTGGFGNHGFRLVRTKITNLVKYSPQNSGGFTYSEEGDSPF